MEDKNNTAKFLRDFFDFLNTNTTYAVLRNYEGLPLKNNSRDIDIIIEKKEFYGILKELIHHINLSGYKIILYYKSERLVTLICGYIGTNINLVQLDFFFSTSITGLLILEAESLLKGRIKENNIWHVCKEVEFLDKYLYHKACGIKYPTKYLSVQEKAQSNGLLNNYLDTTIHIKSFDILEKMTQNEFVKFILKHNIKTRPYKSINHLLLFLFYYIKNFIFYKGFSIAFTGPDGSGKTTVIEEVINIYKQVFHKIPFFHFRPNVIANLGEVAHKAGIKKEVDRQYDKPHRGKKTNLISSAIRLSFYMFDYIIGYFSITRKLLVNRMIIFYDRYYTDIITDSRRSKIFINYKILFYIGKIFVPQNRYNILLTADPNTILARKKELDEISINEINKKIDFLSKKKGYIKILNDTTPKDAVIKIQEIIFNEQHKRNIRKIL